MTSIARRIGRAALGGGVLLVSPVVGPTDSLMAQAWPPDSITNLQVLPEDIAFPDLVATMRGFALGLGVRCSHCHVEGDEPGLANMDFASDEKVTKKKARVMMRMVMHINGEHFDELPERSDPAVEVTCATCHRRLTIPTTMQAVLLAKIAEGGAQAAIDEYEALRERYYGEGVYDFGEFAFNRLAEDAGEAYPNETLTVLDHGLTYFPESWQIHVLKSGIQASYLEDFDAAIASLRAAQDIAPDQPRLQRMIDEMEAARQGGEE